MFNYYKQLTKNWGLEFDLYIWNPLKRLTFTQELDITLQGDHRGVLYIMHFLCVGFDLHVCDGRHEIDIYDESGYLTATVIK